MQQLLSYLNIHSRLSFLEKAVITIGVLDVAYIIWVIVSAALGLPGALPDKWLALSQSEVQSPELMFSVIVLFNVSLAICGWGLLTRNQNFILLNYLHLPFRVLMGVPTLFPLFGLFSLMGVDLSATALLALLMFTEAFRVAVVKKWQKSFSVVA